LGKTFQIIEQQSRSVLLSITLFLT